MKKAPAAVAVHWTADEYIHVLTNMLKYWSRTGDLPSATTQIELYAQFMIQMPKSRQRPAHSSYVNMIRRVFHLWREDPAIEHWFPHTSLHSRVKAATQQSTVVAPDAVAPVAKAKEKKVCVRKPLQAKATPVQQPEQAPVVEAIVSSPVGNFSAFSEQSKALFKEMESTFIARLAPLFTLSEVAQAAVPITPAVVHDEPKLLAPSAGASSAPHKHLFPTVTIQRKSVELPASPTVPTPVALTEADVRRIVREEIEAIFGTTKAADKPAPATKAEEPILVLKDEAVEKPAPFVYIKTEAAEEALPVSAAVEDKVRILVYGLKTVQLKAITDKMPKHVTVVSVDSLNQAKDMAKGADHVIVSRFAGHAVYLTLRNAMGGKALFASGGTSMIKSMIFNLLNAEKKEAALAD